MVYLNMRTSIYVQKCRVLLALLIVRRLPIESVRSLT